MKEKPLKLWAVVIGKKGRHRRYIESSDNHLSVYERREEARARRKDVLEWCRHKDVYVVWLKE